MKKIFLRYSNYEKLKKQLHQLEKVELPKLQKEMSKTVKDAGMHENSSYEDATVRERVLVKRIEEAQEILSKAKIIDQDKVKTDAVNIGTRIQILDLDTSEKRFFNIVGAYETEESNENISYLAPLAQGLLGKKVTETAEIKLPSRTLRYKILEIKRANFI